MILNLNNNSKHSQSIKLHGYSNQFFLVFWLDIVLIHFFLFLELFAGDPSKCDFIMLPDQFRHPPRKFFGHSFPQIRHFLIFFYDFDQFDVFVGRPSPFWESFKVISFNLGGSFFYFKQFLLEGSFSLKSYQS